MRRINAIVASCWIYFTIVVVVAVVLAAIVVLVVVVVAVVVTAVVVLVVVVAVVVVVLLVVVVIVLVVFGISRCFCRPGRTVSSLKFACKVVTAGNTSLHVTPRHATPLRTV